VTFRKRVSYFLVKKLSISNKAALELIISGAIYINNRQIKENIEVEATDEIIYNGHVLQKAKKLIYIAFYKPRGVESTLNISIKDNLAEILPTKEAVFPVGRLDKDSEGLLLLTNDGKIFDKTLRKEFEVEKEYLVDTDKLITEVFLANMANGVTIIGRKTLPAQIIKISDRQFKITLTQGLNRQIRRMCYKLGFEVEKLVRIRIGDVHLGNLKPLEYKILTNKPNPQNTLISF
jgi:23S rRNA pseudouridine2604 synthase